MTFNEAFLLLIRWLHAIAAVAWVGGGLFFLLVLRPAMAASPEASGGLRRRVGEGFGSLVELCMIVLLVSGAILSLDRLTSTATGAWYGGFLGLKITLALYVFWLAWLRRRAARRRQGRAAVDLADEPPLPGRLGRALTGSPAIAVIGVIIVMISDILRLLVERSLAG